MTPQLTLDKLSTELIVKICSYLEIKDLCHLKQTCKRFDEIITSWDNVLCKDISTAVVTNQINEKFSSRCFQRLSKLQKLRISKNWQKGKYFEKSLLGSKRKLIPYMRLTKDHLWISRGENIMGYERANSTLNIRAPYTLHGKKRIDIVNFQIANNILICGLRDGSISLTNVIYENSILKFQNGHTSDVNSVDISECGSVAVSGSRDNELKIWKVVPDSTDLLLILDRQILMRDLIWKVSLSEKCEYSFAVATAGNNFGCSLFIYNLNRSEPQLLRNNFNCGIFDVKWDGFHTLWSCGYDSYLRRWDLRTGKCEQDFLDPCGSALYCFDYDYHNTILTGAQVHGRVTLWDVRQSTALQMYYMDSCKNHRYNRSSPIYSLAFDVDHLFTATDQNLNVLDFSVYNATPKDYSFILGYRVNEPVSQPF